MPLSDLLTFKNGLNKGRAFFGSGTPIVNFMDVIRHTVIRRRDVTGRVTVTPDEAKRYSAKMHDFLFTRTSESVEEIGTPALLVDSIPNAVFSGFVLRGRLKRRDVVPEFLIRALQTQSARDQIISTATYTTRALTNGRSLGRVLVALPTVDEQKAIARALRDVDGLIDAMKLRLAKSRALRQGMMHELLAGHVRLPGFVAPWAESSVGSLVEIVGGGTPSRAVDAYWGGPIPWATVKDISSFNPAGTQEQITQSALRASATRLVSAGTPVLAARMLVGKAVRFSVDVAINQDLKALLTGPSVDPQFLCHWFDVHGAVLAASAGGSTVVGTSTSAIKSLPIALPPIEEQLAIAAALDDADGEIAVLERRLEASRAIRHGMMQELLTGRTRLVPREGAA